MRVPGSIGDGILTKKEFYREGAKNAKNAKDAKNKKGFMY